MTYKEMYNYFYKRNNELPLSAQVDKQEKTIFHLKMEIAKLKKRVGEISIKKGD